MNASRFTPAPIALCLLLAAAAASAGNREPRMHGPGGDGGSTECSQADATPDAPVSAPASGATKPGGTTAAKPAAAPAHVKPVITTARGGSDDSSVHAPRWHSFLPGMFR